MNTITTIDAGALEVVAPKITAEQMQSVRDLDAVFTRQVASAYDLTAEAALTGHDLGTALAEIKRACPSGAFLDVLSTMGVNPERAESAMRIVSGYQRSELEARKADGMRQFALMFTVPQKEEMQQPGNVKVKSNQTHHRWVNEFAGWRQRADKGLAGTIVLEEVKNDTRAIYEWLRVLHGGNEPLQVRGPQGRYVKKEAK